MNGTATSPSSTPPIIGSSSPPLDRPSSPSPTTNNQHNNLMMTSTSSSPPPPTVGHSNGQSMIKSNISTSKKQVTITSPKATLAENTKANMGNASESGRSGGSFSQSKITLRTCCGVVELTSMKLACLLGMVVTVIGLVVLACVAIAAFVTASSKSTDILIAVGKVTSLYESSNSGILKYIYSGYSLTNHNSVLLEYKNKTQEMKITLQTILKNLDDKSIKSLFNSTTIEASNTLDSLNSQALIMIKDQQPEAIEKISSDYYNTVKATFQSGLEQLVSFVQTKEKDKDTQVLAITLVQLIVITISLFVILPIIVFVFTYAINRDSLYLEKIRRANAVMLMDTMEDDGLRAVFKTHCEKEKSIENYLLLEKIQYYRSLCERSLDLQMRLFGEANILSDVSSDISADSAQSSKKKKESPLEKEYAELEAKKYEVAFEIFTEFLEVTGDMAVNISHVIVESVKDKLDRYNDKQLESLPEDMFNILEKETCLVMMDTHHRFKQSLAFQREMKIDKIKVDKLKKKKVVDF